MVSSVSELSRRNDYRKEVKNKLTELYSEAIYKKFPDKQIDTLRLSTIVKTLKVNHIEDVMVELKSSQQISVLRRVGTAATVKLAKIEGFSNKLSRDAFKFFLKKIKEPSQLTNRISFDDDKFSIFCLELSLYEFERACKMMNLNQKISAIKTLDEVEKITYLAESISENEKEVVGYFTQRQINDVIVRVSLPQAKFILGNCKWIDANLANQDDPLTLLKLMRDDCSNHLDLFRQLNDKKLALLLFMASEENFKKIVLTIDGNRIFSLISSFPDEKVSWVFEVLEPPILAVVVSVLKPQHLRLGVEKIVCSLSMEQISSLDLMRFSTIVRESEKIKAYMDQDEGVTLKKLDPTVVAIKICHDRASIIPKLEGLTEGQLEKSLGVVAYKELQDRYPHLSEDQKRIVQKQLHYNLDLNGELKYSPKVILERAKLEPKKYIKHVRNLKERLQIFFQSGLLVEDSVPAYNWYKESLDVIDNYQSLLSDGSRSPIRSPKGGSIATDRDTSSSSKGSTQR